MYAHVMNTNEVLAFYRLHENSNKTYILLVNILNSINTHLYILKLNNLIYLHKLGDIARFNPINHIPAILSPMPLAEANRVNHIPAIL
jgi:hypothetical protein